MVRAVCPVAGTLHGVAVHLTFPGKAPHVGSCPKSKCSVFHSGTHIRGPAFSCGGSLSSAVLKHSVRTGIPLFLPSKPSGLKNEQPERAERPLGRHTVLPASGLRPPSVAWRCRERAGGALDRVCWFLLPTSNRLVWIFTPRLWGGRQPFKEAQLTLFLILTWGITA